MLLHLLINYVVGITGLSDGKWKQVAILQRDNAMITRVDDSARSAHTTWTKLTTYSQVPYQTGIQCDNSPKTLKHNCYYTEVNKDPFLQILNI